MAYNPDLFTFLPKMLHVPASFPMSIRSANGTNASHLFFSPAFFAIVNNPTPCRMNSASHTAAAIGRETIRTRAVASTAMSPSELPKRTPKFEIKT